MSSTGLTRWQWLIVVAHVALAALYGALIPPWEGHDETGHFAYVSHVATIGGLPDARSEAKALFDQSHQPPLYYLLAGVLTAWADRSDGAQPQPNLFAWDGTNRRGFRLMARQPGEDFPWRGTFLALHAARVVSALLTGTAVYLIARSANALFGRGAAAALLTTALAAFNPQLIFLGAIVNNDAAAAATGALVAFLVLTLLGMDGSKRADGRQPRSLAAPAGLGLALGLALLSKNSALALIGFAAFALPFIAWRQRWAVRDLIIRGAIALGGFALITLPYFAHNLARYGRVLIDRNPDNPLISAPTSVIGEGAFVSLRDAWLPQLFANTFQTFWGKFGWGNYGLPDWAYLAFAALCLIGALGCIAGWRRASRETRTGLILLLALGAAMLVLPLYRALFFQDPTLVPGRYLMPALAAYAGLLGFGWAAIVRAVASPRPAAEQPALIGLAVALALFALITPFAFIQPRYAAALTNAPERSPLLTFGDQVELMDAAAHTALLPDREGMRQYARVRLTWRALRPSAEPLAFGVSVLGRDNEVLGTLTALPNRGNYPAPAWRSGQSFVDEVDILLEKPCAALPALGKLSVSAFNFEALTETRTISLTHALPALDGEGRTAAPIVGRFKIDRPPPMPVHWQPPLARFDGIWLREVALPASVAPGDRLTATLTYESVQPVGESGTAFLHLLDERGQLVAQDDHAPQTGAYPTDLWEPGECLRETFTLDIPTGATGVLRAVTGFYGPDGARFETGQLNDLVDLGPVAVARP